MSAQRSMGSRGERPAPRAVPGGYAPDAPVVLKLRDVLQICRDAAELGAAQVAKVMEPQSDRVSQNEAWRLYGRARVSEWLRLGFLTKELTPQGGRITLSRAELVAVDAAVRLHSVCNRAAVEQAVALARQHM